MSAPTRALLRRLAEFKGEGASVVSLYLDVDGRRYVRQRDYEVELERMAHGHGTGNPDVQRVVRRVKDGFDRSTTRGVALFSCAERDLWEVLELAVPVRNQLTINQTPHVGQLEKLLDTHERFGVLLADKQRARMFVFELGRLVDRSELFDQLPRHEDDKGSMRKDRQHDHAAAVAHQHIRRAAQVAFEVHKERPLDHLVLGSPQEVAHELERELHSYLRDRIAARVSVPIGAKDDEIRAAALAVEEDVERAKQAALVERLRDAVNGGGAAVAGLTPVLDALAERRVDVLLVSDGYGAPGWRCDPCQHLAAVGRKCRGCEGEMVAIDDVVEEAVEDALRQGCRIEVCVGNADLDVLGRVGALLRF